jgi:hypothetical protein
LSAPKPKRVRPAAVKRDPVIAALIAKIPAEGSGFSRALRVNWLRQVAMAFDGAFGVEMQIFIDNDPPQLFSGALGGPTEMPAILKPNAAPAPIAGAAEPDEIRYFIDAQGMARVSPGNKRVRPVDVPSGTTFEDERVDDTDLDTIKWADGEWPPAVYPDRSFVFTKAR